MSRPDIIYSALHQYYAGATLEPTDERLRELSRFIHNALVSARDYETSVERSTFRPTRIIIEIPGDPIP